MTDMRFSHREVDWDLVKAYTREGWSASRIAGALGCTVRHVSRVRGQLGIARPHTATPMSEDLLRRAAMFIEDGCSQAEVARSVGVGKDAIVRHFPDSGWSKEQTNEFRFLAREFNRIERMDPCQIVSNSLWRS